MLINFLMRSHYEVRVRLEYEHQAEILRFYVTATDKSHAISAVKNILSKRSAVRKGKARYQIISVREIEKKRRVRVIGLWRRKT